MESTEYIQDILKCEGVQNALNYTSVKMSIDNILYVEKKASLTNTQEIQEIKEIIEGKKEEEITSKWSTIMYIIGGIGGGDEGKGAIADNLLNILKTKLVDHIYTIWCIGTNGGSNAGHSVKCDNGKSYHVHFLNTGALHDFIKCFYGNTKVLEPMSLYKELLDIVNTTYPMNELSEFDVTILKRQELVDSILKRSFFSDCIHVTTIGHLIKDRGEASSSIGTTGKGIGTTYATACSRTGIRLHDIVYKTMDELKIMLDKLYRDMGFKKPTDTEQEIEIFKYSDFLKFDDFRDIKKDENFISITNRTLWDFTFDLRNFKWLKTILTEHIVHPGFFKQNVFNSTCRVLVFELANAFLLDNTFGTYPNVTSSNCTASNIYEATGLNITDMSLLKENNIEIIGVAKSYITRVGTGKLITDMRSSTDHEGSAIVDTLIETAGEFGVTTGRKRRPGWFDLVLVKYSMYINGYKSINLTRLDNLNITDTIKICIAYQDKNGDILDYRNYPTDENLLDNYTPIYLQLKGWKNKTFDHITSFDQFPDEVKIFINVISTALKAPVKYINTGGRRGNLLIH